MITEWVVTALGNLVTFIGGLMPDLTLPEGLTDAIDTISGYAPLYWQLGNALPVEAMAIGLALILGANAIVLVVRIVRIVASFLTAGGGSAA